MSRMEGYVPYMQADVLPGGDEPGMWWTIRCLLCPWEWSTSRGVDEGQKVFLDHLREKHPRRYLTLKRTTHQTGEGNDEAH